MKNVLYWAGRGFMWLCTAGVVLAGVAYLAGRVAGAPFDTSRRRAARR